jgi:hypothetical protein
MLFQLKLLKGVNSLSRRRLAPSEIQLLQEAMSSDYKPCSIRLREGEYQYGLAKALASFQLELYFPDIKDITKRLYGEEKTSDVQFIRKIQTILKKMEKGNAVRILPKNNPWELQRYALPSFKFQDVNNNPVILVTDQQIEQMQKLLDSVLSQQEIPAAGLNKIKTEILVLILMVVASYTAILWDLMQPAVSAIIFIPAFSIAVACSLMLGKLLSQK